ncbi:hypothetical protein DERF_009654 [Dermatophagoides farinae]|uniref:Uncharacterized protein n=1 Tax=Dermatophagoides farinae TaxID=6954 RepID=A0A922HXD0_DERFA|nr:hypothetical protein DERF_009654 [Dermatophagoides farinae]
MIHYDQQLVVIIDRMISSSSSLSLDERTQIKNQKKIIAIIQLGKKILVNQTENKQTHLVSPSAVRYVISLVQSVKKKINDFNPIDSIEPQRNFKSDL